MSYTQCRRAFTVVEMLVVAAVIALLITILLPSLGRVRGVARTTVCASNQHQIYVAMLGTAGPNSVQNAALSARYLPQSVNWPDVPASALSNVKVLKCPEDTSDKAIDALPGMYYYAKDFGGAPFPIIEFKPGFSCLTRTKAELLAALASPPDPMNAATSGANAVGWAVKLGKTGAGQWQSGTAVTNANLIAGWENINFVDYDIEENPSVQAQWHDAGGGSPSYSTNDGVFRVWTDQQTGLRHMKLIGQICSAKYQIWSGSTVIWQTMYVGEESVIDAAPTSYGFNVGLDVQPVVKKNTILLTDFQDRLADPADPLLDGKLLSTDPAKISARHAGRMNVMFSDGSIQLMYPASITYGAHQGLWMP